LSEGPEDLEGMENLKAVCFFEESLANGFFLSDFEEL
jgi:hypothetical protein